MFSVLRNIPLSRLVTDVSLCVFAVVLASVSLPELTAAGHPQSASLLLLRGVVFALITVFLFACLGLYRPVRLRLPATFWRTAAAAAIAALIAYPFFSAATDAAYAGEFVPRAAGYLSLTLLVGNVASTRLRRALRVPRVLIVGLGPDAVAVARDFRESKTMERDVVGFYEATPHEARDAVGDARVFAAHESLVDLVFRHGIDEIVVAVRDQRGGTPMGQLLACRIRGIPILDLADCYERACGEVQLDSLKASWLIYGRGFAQGTVRRVVKRLLDIVGSTILLALFAPVMLITMVLVRLDSPGPALYRQERVGFGGKIFTCIKFRSMRIDAEKDGVAKWAAKNDSRVTKVGQFIRRTRIDELPQLFSVLRGDMSLIGPRPERPSFVEELRKHIPFYDLRHSIKPGLTGWAQVRYGYGATLEDARRKHQFDLYYVKNNSLALDLLVLVETVSVVLFREGQ